MAADPLIFLVVALALGTLFVVSGVKKLKDVAGFRQLLDNYRLLPAPLVPLVAIFLPLMELAVGALLIAGVQPSLAAAGLLLLLYAAAMGINLLRGRSHIDCGCFGFASVRPTIGWPLVGRNVLLAGIALVVAILPLSLRPLGAIDWISGAGAVATAALFYLAFEQISFLTIQRRASTR